MCPFASSVISSSMLQYRLVKRFVIELYQVNQGQVSEVLLPSLGSDCNHGSHRNPYGHEGRSEEACCRTARSPCKETNPLSQKVQTVQLISLRTDGTQTVKSPNPPLSSLKPNPLLLTLLVPFNGTIKNGEVVKIECVDWTGGQIGNNDSADDMKNIDLTKIHYLTGPFEVETAEPGDVLVVEIQDVQPFQEQPWGFTGVFDKNNGGGFLDEIYPNALVPHPLTGQDGCISLTLLQGKSNLGLRRDLLLLATHPTR